MTLPDAIQTYFTAKAPQEAATFAAVFAPEAVVHDEGHLPAEITQWWQAAWAKSRQLAEPLDLTEVAGKQLVRARVSGDFPGSPAILTFTFGLSAGRIADLRIG